VRPVIGNLLGYSVHIEPEADAIPQGDIRGVSFPVAAPRGAAISYIGGNDTPRRAAVCGVAYTAGRMAAYLALGAFLVAGLLSSSTGMSEGIRRRAEKGGVQAAMLLGAVFILVGIYYTLVHIHGVV